MIDAIKNELIKICNYYDYSFEIDSYNNEITIYGHVTPNKRLKLIANQILEDLTKVGFRPTEISYEHGILKAIFKMTDEAMHRYYKNRTDII